MIVSKTWWRFFDTLRSINSFSCSLHSSENGLETKVNLRKKSVLHVLLKMLPPESNGTETFAFPLQLLFRRGILGGRSLHAVLEPTNNVWWDDSSSSFRDLRCCHLGSLWLVFGPARSDLVGICNGKSRVSFVSQRRGISALRWMNWWWLVG